MSEKVKRPRLMVLNEPDGRRFSRALALEIGRDHAEVFLQIEYLISISTTPMMNDRLWTRESVARLQDNHFPYWGKTFIAKTLNELVDGYEHTRYTFEGEGRSRKRIAEKVHIAPLLDKGWFNWGGDTTTWYSLNLDGIAKLVTVQMDSEAMSVAASRKRVTRGTETGLPQSGNPFPDMRKPVPSHAGDFNTEIPTETPVEEEVPEFPLDPAEITAANPAPAPFSSGERKEVDITHPILTTRIYQRSNTDGNAVRAERIYRMVRPAQITLPTTDSKIRSQAETVLLAYFERHGGERQAADALRPFCQAWDAKYPTSPTNLAWLTEWASAGSIPQKAMPKQSKPSTVISDDQYCETGKPLFNLSLDENSPDFTKNYRAWMRHLQTCEQCNGKKSKDRQPASALRDNPLKAIKGLAEGKRI